MKAVLISIQPKWCELIANGKKTVEVRKTRPKMETPFKCYIYKTKKRILRDVTRKGQEDWFGIADKTIIISCPDLDGGKVIGEFVCDRVYDITPIQPFPFGGALDYAFQFGFEKTALTVKEFKDYLDGNSGYGWHISELKIYDKPKELEEFWAYNAELHERFEGEEDFCCYNATNEYGELLNECSIYNTDISRCYHCWEEWSGWCHRVVRPPQSWCYVEVK